MVLLHFINQSKNNATSFHEHDDEIELCDASSKAHFKAAHQLRNRSMVNRSNLVIFYVNHPSGGAYQTMQYTIKSGIPFFNLMDF